MQMPSTLPQRCLALLSSTCGRGLLSGAERRHLAYGRRSYSIDQLLSDNESQPQPQHKDDLEDQINALLDPSFPLDELPTNAPTRERANAREDSPPTAPKRLTAEQNLEEALKKENERKASMLGGMAAKGKGTGKGVTPYTPRSSLHHLYAYCSSNNIILTYADEHGDVRYRVSGGMIKPFKKAQRASYEAGYRCSVQMFERLAEEKAKKMDMRLAILFKGRGQGREALQKALTSSEGDRIRTMVVELTDRTPIKIGGARAKKARRL